jgi:hypothetical protein
MILKRIIAIMFSFIAGVCLMSVTASAENLVEYELPDEDTFFKSYMSYKAITNTDSEQYKLQQICWTDEWGLRRRVDDFIVAMGSYYGTVGDRFKVTLTNGTEFTVRMGDVKANCHTDDKNMYRPVYNENGKFISANILEFIVDTDKLPKEVKTTGTVSSIYYFKGNIDKIEKIIEED